MSDTTTEFWIKRTDFRETKIMETQTLPLEDDQIRVRIDKMGLTANNVSYAVSGDMIGYWKFFPAEGDWGKVPGWAMADVVESNSDAIAVGERLWGFFPMASDVVLTPGKVADDLFMDATPHRKELPALYNQYRRVQGEPKLMQSMEDERCVLFPLFMTSFIIYDYLIDNDFFGAEKVIIGSVSSKTGFGLARLLKEDSEVSPRVVGITSPGNVAFLQNLGCCDQIATYGNEAEIDAGIPSAYVDMSGNSPLTERVHHHIGENIVASEVVGGTHWEAERKLLDDLPGATPKFFFTPAQAAKRNDDWGPGVLNAKAGAASAETAKAVSDQISFDRVEGASAVQSVWLDLLDNKISPNRGLLISI